MVKERQQRPAESINWKAIATGRPRKWDARVMPEDVAEMRARELTKAPWLLYVTVLENGEVLSDKTPDRELIRLIQQSPAVGFIGALRVDTERIQFFSRPLKVGRSTERLLDQTIQALQKRAEDAIRNTFQGKHSVRLEPGDFSA